MNDTLISMAKKAADAWRNDAAYWQAARIIDMLVEELTHPNGWINVKDRLPEKDGWYLVYAPGYWGKSKIYGLDGFAYSNFKHNYKVPWGIERGTGIGQPGIITHWMPLPVSPESRPPEGEEDT